MSVSQSCVQPDATRNLETPAALQRFVPTNNGNLSFNLVSVSETAARRGGAARPCDDERRPTLTAGSTIMVDSELTGMSDATTSTLTDTSRVVSFKNGVCFRVSRWHAAEEHESST